MASFVFLLSLFAATVSLQVSTSPRDKPILIRWEGPVFPSETYRTLYVADINDLWNKVLDMNSDWVAEMPDPDETMTDFGPRTCGIESGLATGNSDEVTSLLTQLRALNGHWTLEAEKCHRIGCRENTGLYWCNACRSLTRFSLNRIMPGMFEYLPSPSTSTAPISGICAVTAATAVSIQATPCLASKPSSTATAMLPIPASWWDTVAAPTPPTSIL
ncbi:hypothetical protein C7999DRAFT_42409 [Corynascus novoguineensis]|uniref:Uncharacterized protein n=1 Tax=Corynascus novoguineensis TaxID=1126955 RepID=A0AAN7HLT3_9PEZI|nr:hypothetical protein C7999DRAFT_42409 [Corynascus novoguineensis]